MALDAVFPMFVPVIAVLVMVWLLSLVIKTQ